MRSTGRSDPQTHLVSSQSSSAQQLRQALGTRLREIRLAAGLTARDLGRLMGRHSSKVSRIEHGRASPSIADIKAWCEHCHAVDQTADLIASLQAVESAYVEWRRLEVTGLRRLQTASVPLYERTLHFRVYHSLVVPGLFQTPGYAAALLGAITAFRGIPDDVEQAVAARIGRQQVLSSGARRFAVVIEESVLRYQVGQTAVMAEQLGRLVTVSALPTVSLGVVPFSLRERQVWPIEGFTVFDRHQVNVELLSARVTVTQPREVAVYAKAFTTLAGMAVYGPAAHQLITSALAALDT